mgnify:CR=1 FL=1
MRKDKKILVFLSVFFVLGMLMWVQAHAFHEGRVSMPRAYSHGDFHRASSPAVHEMHHPATATHRLRAQDQSLQKAHTEKNPVFSHQSLKMNPHAGIPRGAFNKNIKDNKNNNNQLNNTVNSGTTNNYNYTGNSGWTGVVLAGMAVVLAMVHYLVQHLGQRLYFR